MNRGTLRLMTAVLASAGMAAVSPAAHARPAHNAGITEAGAKACVDKLVDKGNAGTLSGSLDQYELAGGKTDGVACTISPYRGPGAGPDDKMVEIGKLKLDSAGQPIVKQEVLMTPSVTIITGNSPNAGVQVDMNDPTKAPSGHLTARQEKQQDAYQKIGEALAPVATKIEMRARFGQQGTKPPSGFTP